MGGHAPAVAFPFLASRVWQSPGDPVTNSANASSSGQATAPPVAGTRAYRLSPIVTGYDTGTLHPDCNPHRGQGSRLAWARHLQPLSVVFRDEMSADAG